MKTGLIKKKALIFMPLFILLSIVILGSTVYAANSESEPNNAYSTADKITLNNTITGRINNDNDQDFYKLTPNSNGYINIKFKHTYADKSFGWNIYTYIYQNGAYTELSNTYIGICDNESIALPSIGAKAGGVYFIKVERSSWRAYDTVGRNYTISTSFTASDNYEKELNDSYYTATKITLGQLYKGNINNNDDKDFYRISPAKNGYVNIKFKHTYADKSFGWNIYTYIYQNGAYTELSNTYIGICDNESIALPSIGAKAGGVYFIKVERSSWRAYDTVGRNYTISTSFTASDNYEKELNDSYYTATKITLGQTYKGNINNNDDKDFYRISPNSSGNINIKFKHTTLDYNNGWSVYTYIYKNGAYTELSNTSIGISDNASISLPSIGAKAGGVYYIKVERSSWRASDTVGRDYKLSTSMTCNTHTYTTTTKKATLTTNGKITKKCKACGYVSTAAIYRPKTVTFVKTSYTYDGSVKNPQLKIRDAAGSTIGTSYYTVTKAKGRVGVGKYTYKVTFKGRYSGTKAVSFVINPPKTSILNVSQRSRGFNVSWNKKTNQISGYQVQYSSSYNFAGAKQTYTIYNKSTQYKAINNLTPGRYYYVRVRTFKMVGGVYYYSGWSNARGIYAGY